MKRAFRGTLAVIRTDLYGVDSLYRLHPLTVVIMFPLAFVLWRAKQSVIRTAVNHYHANEEANV